MIDVGSLVRHRRRVSGKPTIWKGLIGRVVKNYGHWLRVEWLNAPANWQTTAAAHGGGLQITIRPEAKDPNRPGELPHTDVPRPDLTELTPLEALAQCDELRL